MDRADGLLVLHTLGPHGMGVRTLVPRRAGEVIHRFTGKVGPELKQHTLQVSPGLHISETEVIGYLSHSCDPDCRLDMERSELLAVRDIAADEMLTIDYAQTEDVLYRQFACHCGAANCRHWITGRLEGPDEDGQIYLESLE
jgi:hypothetical protein